MLVNYKSKYGVISLSMAMMLSVVMPVSSAFAAENESGAINVDYESKTSLQPVAPAFSVESLLNWSPDNDPDAQLNRASVPLNKKRFKGHQVNPLANPEVNVTAASITLKDHDSTSSVGGNEFDVYAFDNWQLLDSYIYWPGAPNKEGVFAFPSPDIVDAAHLNGVPVYASIGFPWGPGSPETLAEIEEFTKQAKDGSFPVADKMIEMADFYGFDGYFFNQETSGVSKTTALRMNEMMRYIKRTSKLTISWYDSQSNEGTISYQDSINEKNDMYVERAKDGAFAVDEFFLNYNWNVGKIDKTVSTLNKHDHSAYNAYAGFELQQNSYNSKVNTNDLLDENGQSKVSIALYTPNSTMGLADNPAEFHEEENHLWTGPQGDPTKADDSEEWKGIARFAADSSVIKEKPFTTNFNSGHGEKYYADGEEVSSDEWNNRSIQDIMPTWRWWIRGNDSNLTAAYDFEKAFNGGNSLKFEGDLAAGSESEVMLYSTKLHVSGNTKANVVYQNTPGAELSLGISYSKDYAEENMKYYDLPASEKDWEKVQVNLGKDAGKTAYAISLRVKNDQEVKDYQMNVGQLSIFDKKKSTIKSPKNVKVEEKIINAADKAEARLSWKADKHVQQYEVYQENAQGETELLGVTPNNHFYTSSISRTEENAASDNVTTLKVVPVSDSDERGKAVSTNFEWNVDVDATEKEKNPPSENVARNATVTDVSFENPAEPASKALDNSSSSKWAATNKQDGYLTIDIGEEKTIRRWRVEHAENGGEEKNMNTEDFELLYKNKSGEWVSAKRIKDNHDAVTDIVLDGPVTASEFKLQVHNSGSSPWAAIRIYEWQLFESDKLPKTENVLMHFATAKNNEGPNDQVTLEGVKKDQVVKLYNSLESEESLAELVAEEDGTVSFEGLDFGEEAGRVYYTVQAPDVDESLQYSTAYLSEEVTVEDLAQSINLLDLKGAFADNQAVQELKKDLSKVEKQAAHGNDKKVAKSLKKFEKDVKRLEKKNGITKAGAEALTATINEVMQNYKK